MGVLAVKVDDEWVAMFAGPQGNVGADGSAGEKGDPGEPGGSLLTAFWTYATNTSAPPSSGQVRSDSPITTLWVNETDTDGMNRSAGLATAEVGDTIIVRAANGTSMDLLISGTPVDSGTYYSIPVTVTTGTVTKGARTQIGILSPTPHGIPSGGTDGQVLTKTSSADYATAWEDATGGASAGTKMTDLTAQTAGGLVTTDIMETVDISDTTMAASGTNKKLTLANLIAFLTANGVQATDAELTALAGLTSAANQLPYFTGSGTAALTPIATLGRSLIAEATSAGMRSQMQVTIGGTDALPTVAPVRRVVTAQTGTTYTPALTDENKMVTLSNAAAITITLPQNSSVAFLAGAEIDFLWLGVGQPTFVAGSGATVSVPTGLSANIRAQGGIVTAKKIATNDWELRGDLTGYAIGSAIPAGGTIGQILAKTSSTDYAVGWVGSAATTTDPGIIELATLGETLSGTDNVRAVTPLAVATHYAKIRRLIHPDTTTACFTPALIHEAMMVTLSNAAAITVTLPQNSTVGFSIGAEIDFLWLGVGQPTFVAGSGATVNATPGLKLRAQYSACTAKKIATNDWVLIGDLAA